MKKKLITVSAVFLTFLVLLILSRSAPNEAGPGWLIQTVDPDPFTGGISLALDSVGNPHVSYIGYNENDFKHYLKYASFVDSSWKIQTVVSLGIPGYSDSLRSLDSHLSIDSHGNPHISYSDNGTLCYATWNNSTWNIQTIDTNEEYSSLALDSSGNPHISYIVSPVFFNASNYYIQNNSSLKYASWTGSKWNIDTIFSSNALLGISLALDSAGNPHISYENENSLQYASWNSSAWIIQTLSYGDDSSLVLDSKGNPSLSFFEVVTSLVYESWNGTGWNKQTVDNSVWTVYNSLALDSKGNPHIIYDNEYASSNGSKWNIQPFYQYIASSGILPIASGSLAMDSNDNPHIIINYAGLIYLTETGFPTFYAIIIGVAVAVVVLVAVLLMLRKAWVKKPKIAHIT
jgi:hypothetical protein